MGVVIKCHCKCFSVVDASEECFHFLLVISIITNFFVNYIIPKISNKPTKCRVFLCTEIQFQLIVIVV